VGALSQRGWRGSLRVFSEAAGEVRELCNRRSVQCASGMDSTNRRRPHCNGTRYCQRGDTLTLKLYAVEGTRVNDWLARLKKGVQQLDDPRLIHGILTYDYFQMIRAIREKNGELAKPDDWTPIAFPLAFVVLGPTSVVPWEDQ